MSRPDHVILGTASIIDDPSRTGTTGAAEPTSA